MVCTTSGDLTICSPNSWTVFVQSSEVKARWCFGCRTRQHFVDTLEGESAPSWYEDIWLRRCPKCGLLDGDLGFGWSRECE